MTLSPLLWLASSSPIRRQLISRLGYPFQVLNPAIDETPHGGETAPALVQRLAQTKAAKVYGQHPQGVIIGADQVASCRGVIYGKPGNYSQAVKQLQDFSGQTVTFYGGLSVVSSQGCHQDLATSQVHFRPLSMQLIQGYLQREQPFHCCGSFKSEGLAIALVSGIDNDDPSSILGLSMIRLSYRLQQHGIDLLALPMPTKYPEINSLGQLC